MTNRGLCSLLLCLASCTGDPDEPAMSPYAMQPPSPIAGLSAQELDDLLQGRGMGLARAAELSGYPGPRHVLDLAGELGLQDAQRDAAQAIFERMQAAAKELGARIVEAERALAQSFSERNASAESTSAQVAAIAELQGELRAVHLSAHIELTARLDHHQIAKYNQLRGYAAHGGGHH
jgi:hypothetical protein